MIFYMLERPAEWADRVAVLCLIPLIMRERCSLSNEGRAAAADSSVGGTSMTRTDRTNLRDKVRTAYSAAAEVPQEKHAFPVGREIC